MVPFYKQSKAMRADSKKKLVTRTGIITVHEWDMDGNVLAITLFDHTEQHYIIADNSKGQELFHHIQHLVKVEGFLTTRGLKPSVIEVRTLIKIILPFENPIHRGWLCCSSVAYPEYASSARLAIRAPRASSWQPNFDQRPNSFQESGKQLKPWKTNS